MINWLKSLLLRLLEWLLSDSLPDLVREMQEKRRREAAVQAELKARREAVERCHVVTFRYSDDSTRSFHTRCDKKSLRDLGPSFGRSLVNQPPDVYPKTINGMDTPVRRRRFWHVTPEGTRAWTLEQVPYDGVVLKETSHSSHPLDA